MKISLDKCIGDIPRGVHYHAQGLRLEKLLYGIKKVRKLCIDHGLTMYGAVVLTYTAALVTESVGMSWDDVP
jgi:hypothetical protein